MDYMKISPPSPLPISFTGDQKTILNEQSKFRWRWQPEHKGPQQCDPTRCIEMVSDDTLKKLRSFCLGNFGAIWDHMPKCIPSNPMMIVNAKKTFRGGQKFRSIFLRVFPSWECTFYSLSSCSGSINLCKKKSEPYVCIWTDRPSTKLASIWGKRYLNALNNLSPQLNQTLQVYWPNTASSRVSPSRWKGCWECSLWRCWQHPSPLEPSPALELSKILRIENTQ